jgi:hypothetical protein
MAVIKPFAPAPMITASYELSPIVYPLVFFPGALISGLPDNSGEHLNLLAVTIIFKKGITMLDHYSILVPSDAGSD